VRRLREAGVWIAAVGGLLALALLLGCAPSRRTRMARTQAGDPCQKLAYTFYLVAELKERGVSEADQVRLAWSRADGSEETRDQWLHVVDLVYRFSDGEPYEIGATVLDHCEIGEDGRAAVVTTLWPTRRPDVAAPPSNHGDRVEIGRHGAGQQ
jgi:hypothetical protein